MKQICLFFIFWLSFGYGVLNLKAGPAPVLYPVKITGKWGFIDKKGKLVVEAHFEDVDKIYNFVDGLCGVELDGKWGFINNRGKIVIQPTFDGVKQFHEGLAGYLVKSGGPNSWGYIEKGFIDKTGKIVIEAKYEDDYSGNGIFKEGLCVVKAANGYGIIDKKGNIILPLEYKDVTSFDHGVAEVQDNDSIYWIIDKKGKKISVGYKRLTNFSNGFASATLMDGQSGIVNTKGIFTPVPGYSVYYFFSFHCEDNVFVVTYDNKYALMNTKGKRITELVYGSMSTFVEGKIATNSGGKKLDSAQMIFDKGWGYLDKKGKIAIPFNFQNVIYFSDGASAAEQDNKWGYIDTKGNWILKPQFDKPQDAFIDGIARIEVSEKNSDLIGYINKKGQYIWLPQN